MTGLVPVIHVVKLPETFRSAGSGGAWMAGTSPAMTERAHRNLIPAPTPAWASITATVASSEKCRFLFLISGNSANVGTRHSAESRLGRARGSLFVPGSNDKNLEKHLTAFAERQNRGEAARGRTAWFASPAGFRSADQTSAPPACRPSRLSRLRREPASGHEAPRGAAGERIERRVVGSLANCAATP